MRMRDWKVPPLAVRIDLAEDEGGIELGHALHVDQAHQIGLRQQVEAGDGEDSGGVEAAERGCVVFERGAKYKASGARGVAKAVEAPQHEDTDDDDGREGSAEAEGKFAAGAFGGGEDLPADEQQEHGGQENAGVFGGEEEAAGDAGQQQAEEGGLLYVAIEGVDAEEKEERDADVGGDEGRVRQDVGVEDDEEKGGQSCGCTEPLPRGEEDDKGEGQREQAGGESHAEDQALARAVVAGEKVAAVEIGLGFELASLQGRYPEVFA